MSSGDIATLCLELAALLLAGLLAGQVVDRLRLPIVIGELLAGIALGPTVAGHLFPGFYAAFFPMSGAVRIGRDAFIQLGLACFMFSAGLEMDVPALARVGRKVVWTSGLGIAVPFATGVALALADPGGVAAHCMLPRTGTALFLGTALSISALPVIARILMDLGLNRHELGTLVLSSATLDDLVGWSLFAGLLGSFSPSHRDAMPAWVPLAIGLGLATLTLTVGRWLARRLRETVRARVAWHGGPIGVGSVLWLLGAAVAEYAGFHAVVGAFLAGLALAQGGETRDGPTEVVHQFTVGVFAPIYFASIGLKADFAAHFDLRVFLVVVAVACVGKVGGVTLGGWIAGMDLRRALAVGFGMNARGAMEMILATVALDAGLIDEQLFVALVGMALVTSIMSGPIMGRLVRAGRLDRPVAAG